MAQDVERPDWMDQIQAVLFDMDGTLLDSEHLTARAIEMLLEQHDVQVSIDGPWFHGVTWRSIAATLQAHAAVLRDVPVASRLQENFHLALVQSAPPPIPGAPEAVLAAASMGGTAVVSSSDRASVLHVVDRFGLRPHLDLVVTAEDVERSKPDPQCFQIAAGRLGVECAHCLVFEDSVAGLTAGRAAGMRTIAIGEHHAGASIADLVIADFNVLADGFFSVAEAM